MKVSGPQILKYLFSGAVGISTNLICFKAGLVLGIQYLVASTLAISVSTIVGFLLQKHLTFAGNVMFAAPTQFMLYAGVAIGNLGINAAVVYALVDGLHTDKIFAQAAGAALVAISSFFIYKYGIFRHHGS